MNCKPGDMAMITSEGRRATAPLAGRLVEVLYLAPEKGLFDLPDGQHCALEPSLGPRWAVKLDEPIPRLLSNGIPGAPTLYICVPDRYLLPIRPEPDGIETTTHSEVHA